MSTGCGFVDGRCLEDGRGPVGRVRGERSKSKSEEVVLMVKNRCTGPEE